MESELAELTTDVNSATYNRCHGKAGGNAVPEIGKGHPDVPWRSTGVEGSSILLPCAGPLGNSSPHSQKKALTSYLPTGAPRSPAGTTPRHPEAAAAERCGGTARSRRAWECEELPWDPKALPQG